jgi:hypothetical protein
MLINHSDLFVCIISWRIRKKNVLKIFFFGRNASDTEAAVGDDFS